MRARVNRVDLIRLAAIFSISVLSLLLLVYGGLSYAGFCWKERRWLSDQEKIDAAVVFIVGSSIFNELYYDVDGRLTAKKIKPIRYSGIKEFYRKNPDCCKVVTFNKQLDGERYEDWSASLPSLYDRISGVMCSKVRVKYKIIYVEESGSIRAEEKTWYPVVGSCGRIWGGPSN